MTTTPPTAEAHGPPFWQPGDFEQQNGFPRYRAHEIERRHRFVAGLIEEHELDALVVGGPTGPLETSVQFFTNWPAQVQSYVVFSKRDEPILFVRLWNHLPDAERIAVVDDVRYGGDTPADQADAVVSALSKVGASRVGMIGVVPHADLLTLQRRLSHARYMDLNREYQRFRLAKSEEEMVFVRIASKMNDAAIAALDAQLRPGIREYEVARIIEDNYLSHRAWNLIHFSLSTPMADPQVCVPHQYHPDRTIERGDVFVTEISTTFWGYAGQILRTFTIGAEPTNQFRELHDVALDTYHAVTGVMRTGVTVGEVLDAAERISRAGFDVWDDLCHGFGGAYLPPIVRTRASRGATHPDDFSYPDGALVVVQPNVVDGRAGVQVGNSMRLTTEGPDVTQSYPTELIVCA